MEEIEKAGQIIQELVQNHTVEQSVDHSVPPVKEEIVEVGQTTTPQELVFALASKDENHREGSPVAHPSVSVDTSNLEHAQKLEEVRSHGLQMELLNSVPQRLCWWLQQTRPLHQTAKRCGTSFRPGSGKCTMMLTWRQCVSGASRRTSRPFATNGANDQNLMFQLGCNEFADLTSQEFAARYTGLKLANLSSVNFSIRWMTLVTLAGSLAVLIRRILQLDQGPRRRCDMSLNTVEELGGVHRAVV